jgi:hypothetical protein
LRSGYGSRMPRCDGEFYDQHVKEHVKDNGAI